MEKEEFCDTPVLNTDYGKVIIEKGYYRVISTEEGNYGKYLHRLIYEHYHCIKLPPDIHIHHKDGNKLNNCILNLEPLSKSEHHKLHSTGVKHSLRRRINIGKPKNTSGYFRVHVHKDNHCKQGFRYIYEFREDGKRYTVSSVSIHNLKKKVEERNWPWIEHDKGELPC